jgi:hypothetical protein
VLVNSIWLMLMGLCCTLTLETSSSKILAIGAPDPAMSSADYLLIRVDGYVAADLEKSYVAAEAAWSARKRQRKDSWGPDDWDAFDAAAIRKEILFALRKTQQENAVAREQVERLQTEIEYLTEAGASKEADVRRKLMTVPAKKLEATNHLDLDILRSRFHRGEMRGARALLPQPYSIFFADVRREPTDGDESDAMAEITSLLEAGCREIDVTFAQHESGAIKLERGKAAALNRHRNRLVALSAIAQTGDRHRLQLELRQEASRFFEPAGGLGLPSSPSSLDASKTESDDKTPTLPRETGPGVVVLQSGDRLPTPGTTRFRVAETGTLRFAGPNGVERNYRLTRADGVAVTPKEALVPQIDYVFVAANGGYTVVFRAQK